jgi:hypothetical protein
VCSANFAQTAFSKKFARRIRLRETRPARIGLQNST